MESAKSGYGQSDGIQDTFFVPGYLSLVDLASFVSRLNVKCNRDKSCAATTKECQGLLAETQCQEKGMLQILP